MSLAVESRNPPPPDCTRNHDEAVSDGAMRIIDAVIWSGVSRSQLYLAMSCGDLMFIKVGKRRLIPRLALRNYLASRIEEGDR